MQFLFFSLLFFYLALTLVVSAFMLFDGMIWGGIALLIGSLLGFAGGSGMRGSFYRGQKRSGIVFGVTFAVAGMLLVFVSDVVLQIFELRVPGDNWVLLGFGLGFLAARPEDAAVEADPATN